MERTDTSFLDSQMDTPIASVRLFVEELGRPPRVVVLHPGLAVRIGRAEDLEIALDDPRASRCHAAITFDGQSVTVEDFDSSNGTWLGERRIQGRQMIPAGTLIRVGSTRIAIVPTEAGSVRPETHGPVVGPTASGTDVVAVDPATVTLFALVRRLAASDLPVLVQGETGSGKEVVARALHRYSPRSAGPFMAINCATLPEALAESELFGHERGSFTGAATRKVGVFESADGGTLLLDEVGELSAASQARLLRALQERLIVRVGATRPIPVNVRVVAATNRDLMVEVAKGRFREDLYFRLNGVTMAVPALRSRPRDILPLVQRALEERGSTARLGPGVAAVLQGYKWPGNVRELRNTIECALALAEGNEIRIEHLPPTVRGELHKDDAPASPLRERVDETERRAIVAALENTGWNQSRAARMLGISRRALIYKMERFGLKPLPNSARQG